MNMRNYLNWIAAVAVGLTLSACGGESAKPAEPQPTPAETKPAENTATSAPASTPAPAESSAPADASGATGTTSASGDCSVTVVSDDAMKFNTQEIAVKSSCKDFTINLEHAGKAPKTAMGHNIVIAKSADKAGVLGDAVSAGADKDFLKADDTRIIAHTKMIGGGEKDSVTFAVNKLSKDGDYEFFCSFPGHAAMMTGKVKLVD